MNTDRETRNATQLPDVRPKWYNAPAQERRQIIRGAVARGWCDGPNRRKEMDSDLAEAIVEQILLITPREVL